WIIGDLGPSGGNARNQRRLAGVGIADKTHIGQQLQLQSIVAFLAGAAQFVLTRGLMGAGGKVLVTAAAAPTFGNDHLLIGLLEVVYKLSGVHVIDRSAHRHLQSLGVAIKPGAVGPHAVLAALRLVLRVIAELDQRVVAIGGHHDYVAAAPAVAARGSAAGHKLLTPEGHAAVAAVACLHANFCFINK